VLFLGFLDVAWCRLRVAGVVDVLSEAVVFAVSGDGLGCALAVMVLTGAVATSSSESSKSMAVGWAAGAGAAAAAAAAAVAAVQTLTFAGALGHHNGKPHPAANGSTEQAAPQRAPPTNP